MVGLLAFMQQVGSTSIGRWLFGLWIAARIFRADRGVISRVLVCTFWLLAGDSVRAFEWELLTGRSLEESPFSAYLMSVIARANIFARWGADSVPMAHNPAQS